MRKPLEIILIAVCIDEACLAMAAFKTGVWVFMALYCHKEEAEHLCCESLCMNHLYEHISPLKATISHTALLMHGAQAKYFI